MNHNKPFNTREITGGLILVALGTVLLIAQFAPFDDIAILIPLLLGVGFMMLGIVRRDVGWMIPGGILGGIGAGIALIAGPAQPLVSGVDEGAVFMTAFGAGWAAIAFSAALFGRERAWWALIPAAVMWLIAATVAWGGVFETVLTTFGRYWPVVLIALGLYALLQPRRQEAAKP